ncbi:hypothetical protein VTN77DRAFT_3021 [Rasamsonia byssochlamydoides]|uniref:mitochondrial 54S ribosomal protein bL32m n=1 Tax=Rasamsonia byssochlamydoides TaxID=89139 RepID=UPI0037440A30
MALRTFPASASARFFPRPVLSTSIMPFSFAAGTWIRQNNVHMAASTLLTGASTWSIPSFLSDIWDSVLRAVPKKKTSHMKKRHRQMAGKALKDVKNLTTCSGCGQIKRAHVLCPDCVKDIKSQWKQLAKE